MKTFEVGSKSLRCLKDITFVYSKGNVGIYVGYSPKGKELFHLMYIYIYIHSNYIYRLHIHMVCL